MSNNIDLTNALSFQSVRKFRKFIFNNLERKNSTRYHYPRSHLEQPYYTNPGTGKVTLNLSMLGNTTHFVSPLMALLNQLRSDGFDVTAPFDEAVAMRVLEAQIGLHAQYVFVWHGKPVGKTSTKSWKAALVRAGIDVMIDEKNRETSSFRWHDLRHTWASWHIMNGTPIEVLQKLGGWRTLSMVLRYAHLAPEHLAQYAENAAPRDLMGHKIA